MIYQPFKHIPPYRKGGYDLPPVPDKNKKDEKNNSNNSKTLAI